jgi:hypothetical protein
MGTPLYRPLRLYAQHIAPAFQRQMVRPAVRGRRLPTPTRRCVAVRERLLQPALDYSTNLRRQTAPVRRGRYHRGPLLAQQTVVPRPPATCHHNPAYPAFARLSLSGQARQARRGRTTRLEHRSFSRNTPPGSTLDADP